MRVLAIVNDFPVADGTDGNYALRTLQALRERGHDIRVIRILPWLPPLRRWHVRGAVAREVRAFDPHIVQIHGLLSAGVLALDLDVPFVLTGHGGDTCLPFARNTLERLARRVVSRAAACVGVSRDIADTLGRLGARHTNLIYNCADERIFFRRDRREARRTLGLDTYRPCILYAGRTIPQEGLAAFHAAVLQLADLYPQVVIAGAGECGMRLRDALLGVGIEAHAPRVTTPEQLALMMSACDVLVLSSHREGLAAILCEAMNAHCAIVAVGAGRVAEIVRDGETGFVVPPCDAGALARHVRLVLEDPNLRAHFERAAGAIAARHLTWPANARAYEALYERIAPHANLGMQRLEL